MTDNSRMSGFNTLSTLRFENFTERNLSELERILISLRDSADYQNITNFYFKLSEHLTNTAAHQIDISQYSDIIIDKLYETYRRYGGTASRSEILLQIEKDIPVATNADIAAGINDSKAVTAKQFKNVFNRHVDNLNAHEKLRNAIMVEDVYPGYATLYLSSLFRHDLNTVDVTDIWNNSEGTLILRNKIREPGLIFAMKQGNAVVMSFTVDAENNIVVTIGQETLTIPIATGLIKDCIVVTYTLNEILVADATEVISIPRQHDLNITTLELPNGISDTLTGNDLYNLVYYPLSATRSEVRFLLN